MILLLSQKCGLAMACKLYEFNFTIITDFCDYENKDNIQVQLKTPSPSFKEMLDHYTLAEQSNIPNKTDWQKNRIPMNPYIVLIDVLKRRSHPYLYAMPVWATWSNIWWVKQKRCLKVQLTKILVFFYHDDLSLMTAKETRKWMK